MIQNPRVTAGTLAKRRSVSEPARSELLANDPTAEIKKLPMAHMTQETQPRFFARKRSPPNVADDCPVAPHEGAVFKILERWQPKSQSLRIDLARIHRGSRKPNDVA